MFRDKKRYGQDGSDIHRSSDKTFFSPLSWKDPAMVFTCSWSDFFLKEVDPWREEAWEVIRKTPHLTYQILTKRPENIKDRLPDDWPLKNVWLGVTAENQEMAMARIPTLLNIDAAIHFVSCEPMLEEIDLTEIYLSDDTVLYPFQGTQKYWFADKPFLTGNKIDWIICGGESGSNFRGMETKWASFLHYQCMKYNTPFFMKQMAGINPRKIPIPDILKVKEFPSKQPKGETNDRSPAFI